MFRRETFKWVTVVSWQSDLRQLLQDSFVDLQMETEWTRAGS